MQKKPCRNDEADICAIENVKADGVLHKLGIISDTHGILRPQTAEILKMCDAILHAGDIDTKEVLDKLNSIAPVYAVRGNADGEWAAFMKEELSFKLYGINFHMIHNKKKISGNMENADIIIYGHSHKYEEKNADGRLYLNPGSCGARRFRLPVTMAVIEITKADYRVKKIDISDNVDGSLKDCLNIKQIINSVIKDTNRGIPVKEIASRNGIEEKLAEQICRLYLTHPGVDADGIMTKMGL